MVSPVKKSRYFAIAVEKTQELVWKNHFPESWNSYDIQLKIIESVGTIMLGAAKEFQALLNSDPLLALRAPAHFPHGGR